MIIRSSEKVLVILAHKVVLYGLLSAEHVIAEMGLSDVVIFCRYINLRD